MSILFIGNLETPSETHDDHAVRCSDGRGTGRLVEYATTVDQTKVAAVEEKTWREQPVDERLAHAVIKGIVDYIDEDVEEARQKASVSLEIIEGPLMKGMSVVGELFGAGLWPAA